MRNFLIALAIFLVFLILADFVVKGLAEDRVADQMQESLDLSHRPKVSVDAWPFVVHVMEGHFDGVTVNARDVTERGLKFRRIELLFEDVDFPTSQLLSQKKRSVDVESATGTAVITEDALTEAVQSRGVPATVQLSDDTAVVQSELGAETAAHLSLEDGNLVVVPEGELQPMTIDLPPITGEVDYQSVRIDDGLAVLTLQVGRTTLEF
jgi:LmeA-like phospholipid-binding